MCGTLEVGLMPYLHSRHQHYIDEGQKAETVLSAVNFPLFFYIGSYTIMAKLTIFVSSLLTLGGRVRLPYL